ncbi:MAG: helix-turn-helix domain-containing protein [Clostridium tyrobutyricum]|jgi:transcriptional regulator with XRE-family HTH domain|uniref:helix-turn-helix domain-containing protein n=1 Tax=Clostridium TaxID=1485 RepID=UPI001009FEE1|nr:MULTISPECIES: helix-turn-helix transcriptional regulator [Clostridium]NFK79394.1 helix-turn-helix transcriptional regulator [Clostridium botulinum]MBV4420343.1 helix-turn-helix domain-containing protein [Clostridium tyrobutyricum]MCH4198541.1 helix-turn-helix domain-containing protein [Clostridium tyrobutyricum]MCH4238253.1 helix-turn-helix domain-containing protein [Clostridium tyrobutyricum]MCH4258923.1 helix-turn-helix domain-containing protein [Clostridium tyrobutyricum]
MSPNKFGEFVAYRRKEKKISLRKMAELLDLSPAYWSDIEKGRRNPPNINKLQEIAKLLGLSHDELDEMIDMASEDRDEIPMDLPNYIKESNLARTALRKARKMDEVEGKSDITEKAWKDFIKALEEEE